jgi:hypothetical protein
MAQSMIVLLYAAYRFSLDAYGKPAAILLLLIFAAIEALLFWLALRRSPHSE